ncbi:MAG: MoxR family ATPase [Thermoanaerobaculia bacterium]|nr:MoxR family ATPase [Thermoanaerobaculia bacterium]
MAPAFDSIEALDRRLREESYFASSSLATTLFLALRLAKPVLLEGEAGVGKTEVAKVLAAVLGRKLIRLQCYEGLDLSTAVYEWDYSRQILEIKLMEAAGAVERESAHKQIFHRDFLLERPLLAALSPQGEGVGSPVLLIDELDRADEEFEAFLLEILSDFQVTVPELGTLRAATPPIVVITSNRTREVHDALRRRCLYQWIDYPSLEKELEIVQAKVPEAPARLAGQVVAFVQALREEDLYKRPGVAETLDWMRALVSLDRELLTARTVEETSGALLKYQDDVELVRGEVVERLLARSAAS